MKKFVIIILRSALILAILFTALPTPVRAASVPEIAGWNTKCVCLFQIEKGDNLNKIARIFGITAKEIADANYITTSTKLKVGQVLCIPRVAFTKLYPKASLSGEVALKWLFLEGSHLPAQEKYFVRIRVPNQIDWVKVGAFKTDKYGEFDKDFRIPNTFLGAKRFEVCVKHINKSYTVCTFVKRLW